MIGQPDVLAPESSDRCQQPTTLKLITTLCNELHLEGVTYCHWKSNDVLERSRTGENDLDLLILKEHAQRFTEVLSRLGFKQTQSPRDQSMPGVVDFYGHDEESGRIIHVHSHFRLVIGDDRAKNYRLPFEKAYLANTTSDVCFPTPQPELEFVVFMMRMMLKHCCWDAVLAGKGRIKPSVRAELAYLQSRVDLAGVDEVLARHMPLLSPALFTKCIQSVEPSASLWCRVSTAWKLQNVLAADTRRPYLASVVVKAWRGFARSCRRRLVKRKARRRLSSGGAIIAIVGGDGAGKSTTVKAASSWLAGVFATKKCHLGKPRKSWTTKLVTSTLKIQRRCGLRERVRAVDDGSVPGLLVLIREACIARDRYRAYVKARRFANQGALVVCDRFPTPQITCMDHPRIRVLTEAHRSGRLVNWLLRIEEDYYRAIRTPEVLLVLRLDPEIAVRRRTDEDSDFVRRRSTEVWQLDDSQLDAHIVDSSQDKEDMLAEVRQLIWSKI